MLEPIGHVPPAEYEALYYESSIAESSRRLHGFVIYSLFSKRRFYAEPELPSLRPPSGGPYEPLLDTQTSRNNRARFSAPLSDRRFSVQMNWEFHMSSKGTIKRIVSDKGFGFVADESGQEYFFHQSACQSFDSLREGQAVTFQTGQGPKGPRAENVREA